VIVVESVCLLFCSVSYYTVRVYWCEVARSHVYRLVSTAARVSSTRSRLDETEPTAVGSVSSRRSSRATPSRRVSDSSATPHFSALPKGSGGWDFSRRSRRALFASGSALRSFGGLLGRPPFLGFGDAVLAARAAQAPCALSPVLALLPRPAALPPAAAFLPLGLVTGPGAHAKTGRTASSSGFLAPRAS